MKNSFYLINHLRIHVILLHLIILWQLVAVKFGNNLSREHYQVILSLSLILGFVYVHNRYTEAGEGDRIPKAVISIQYLSLSMLFFGLILAALFSFSLFLTCLFFTFVGYLYNQGFNLKKIFVPRLKNIFIVKTLVASFSWYGSVIACIYFVDGYRGGLFEVIDSSIHLLFLFIAFEVWWDIRDLEEDKKNKTQTLPVVFGVLPTFLFFISFITISALLKFRDSFSFVEVARYFPLIVGFLITLRYKIGYHLAVYGFIIFILFQSFS